MAPDIHYPARPPPPPSSPPIVALASQHHRSDYNRLKFGPAGAPVHYSPLSLHTPDVFATLLLRQARTQHIQVWWLAQPPPPPPVPSFSAAGPRPDDLATLQPSIHAALLEPLHAGLALARSVKTSVSHPLNISPIIPPDLIAIISSRLALSTTPTLFSIPLSFSLDHLLTCHSRSGRACLESVEPDLTVDDPAIARAPLGLLGNLFLSSCPGKKVRLDGPTGGRSGVCRDIVIDMQRIKDLGVGCIICCLDDEELSFIGIPWSAYQRSARDIGLDVSRLPTPEGLAPPDPASLDDVLLTIIKNYTLRGVPVLVHCRGGVGRAGVVACCWLIRLGLCGWIQERKDQAYTHHTSPSAADVQFLRGVIGIVRSRRSTKAVETYEQVKFLFDYVEYLRQGR
ncbi:hypothetical protein APHAL10511_000085 [Amanita phalloides]|nr:hypothetical protein APHAL10511_000085 [Amanita phalloides]